MSVHELLYIEKCEKGDEDIGSKKNAITALISIIFGLLGCGIIVLSTIKQISDSWNFFAIILLMFFSYSFFYNFLKIIFLHLKNGKWKYHKKRFFISRQITSKMVPNISLFTGVTMAMTLALFAINWGIYFSNKVDERVNAVAFDVAFFNEEENTDFSSFLSFLNKKNELVNSYEYNLYTNYENSFYLETQKKIRGKFEFTISSTENDVFMSETDYVNLRSILDLKPIMLPIILPERTGINLDDAIEWVKGKENIFFHKFIKTMCICLLLFIGSILLECLFDSILMKWTEFWLPMVLLFVGFTIRYLYEYRKYLLDIYYIQNISMCRNTEKKCMHYENGIKDEKNI